MKVAIIKYNAGNIHSVLYGLKRLGVDAEVTDDKEKIIGADKVIFPGVGEASTTMAFLKESGMDNLIVNLKQPVLGICLGLQLMCKHSTEGDTTCLGIFDNNVVKFDTGMLDANNGVMKVPHMGWNSLQNLKSGLFDQSIQDKYVYFVHSYYAELSENTIASCEYVNDFSAALHKDNFYATQFHPEKSGPIGRQILENFIKL